MFKIGDRILMKKEKFRAIKNLLATILNIAETKKNDILKELLK